ncbi:MAG: N-acetyl-gamma-glutamyl-phosphate reductase [Butyricicoccus pullicaecorum]|nr:N-acetyl-gamma-glutamyl-phosphate reductase [Butyricicoccus pullicaecorum]
MRPKIYIDGKEGTTGLQIYERLGARDDLDLLLISPDKRKDLEERRRFLNAADIVFLCLPDAAAREAVSLIENPHTRVIDASTAHRTAADWTYGFAELSPAHRTAIQQADRVANPGCHATGFISIVYPLVSSGLLSRDTALTCFSLTGYSGGGKNMIASYEAQEKSADLYAPRIYGLHLQHKHLPEMQTVCALTQPPVFCPVVDDYYKGMATTVSLPNMDAEAVWEQLSAHYAGQSLVSVAPLSAELSMLSANTFAGRDSLTLYVNGHQTQTIVTALFDNLGKGASGAAVQNMNLMLGLEETTGLTR